MTKLNNLQLIDVNKASDNQIESLSSASSFNAFHQIAFSASLPLNYSFLLEEEGKIVAACPLVVEKKIINDVNYNIGSLFNLSLPEPLILDYGDNKKNIKKIVRIIFQKIDEYSIKANISKIQYNFPYLDCCNELRSIFYKELYKRNYIDVSLISQRIDITKSPNTIFKEFSKGHRAIIKKINTEVIFRNIRNLEIPFGEFQNKMNLYDIKDKTVEYIFNLYQKNRLEFCDIFFDSKELGSSVFLKNNRDVSYFLAYKKKEIAEGIHHKVLWEAVKKYHLEKYSYLDLGLASYGININYIPSAKQLAITHFKSGFGGEVHPFVRFEKLFDKNLYEFEQNEKVINYKNNFFNE